MANPECPTWPGAATAYSRACRILSVMAQSGHVTPSPSSTKRRPQMTVSAEMRDFIDALGRGNEEQIKELVLEGLHLLSDDDLRETAA